MFGLFEKKKEQKYFCSKCGEFFTDKFLEAKNYTTLKCPFCGSLKCYEIKGKNLNKDIKTSK